MDGKKTYIVPIAFREVLCVCFAHADTVNMFHDQYSGCTAVPYPWNFETRIVAEVFRRTKGFHERGFTNVVAFIRKFCFHSLRAKQIEHFLLFSSILARKSHLDRFV